MDQLNMDLRDLADRLGIERARTRGKYHCPKCGSKDNLHIYAPPRDAYCFGMCGPFDAFGLVMAARSCSFREACQFLEVDSKPSAVKKSYVQPERQLGNVDAYRWIYDNVCTPLIDPHAEWLHGRGIRSVDARTATPAAWAELCDVEAAEEIGVLSSKGKRHPWWTEPFIVVPYYDAAGKDIVDLRFRRTHDCDGPKMFSLTGQRLVPVPYLAWHPHADFAEGHLYGKWPYDGPLWIVEGEWDALLLREHGACVVATPGANVWHKQWTAWVHRVSMAPNEFNSIVKRRVIVVGDGDDAGRAMSEKVGGELRRVGINAESHTWPDGDAGDNRHRLADVMGGIL